MAGTTAQGKAAAATNKKKYGPDFYRKIGAMGGKKTHESGQLAEIGFAANPDRARIAGTKGGKAKKTRKRTN